MNTAKKLTNQQIANLIQDHASWYNDYIADELGTDDPAYPELVKVLDALMEASYRLENS